MNLIDLICVSLCHITSVRHPAALQVQGGPTGGLGLQDERRGALPAHVASLGRHSRRGEQQRGEQKVVKFGWNCLEIVFGTKMMENDGTFWKMDDRFWLFCLFYWDLGVVKTINEDF